jgi:hypothetical protein
MRAVRFSIGGLMGAVVVAALGLTALRADSAIWAGVTLLWTSGVLCLAIVGVVCRRGAERAWWLGFALFGWGYLAAAFWSERNFFEELPTAILVQAVSARIDPALGQSAGAPGGRALGLSVERVAHYLWALVAAILGGTLGRAFMGDPVPNAGEAFGNAQSREVSPAHWWRRPAVIGLAGLGLVASTALAGSRWAPGLWAGITFLLTCGLLGLATLGAIVNQGKLRRTWLGASLFGVTYMVLTFGRSPDNSTWPYSPTSHLLNALRAGFPPHRSGFPDTSERSDVVNARLLNALERPIPLRFPQETPLEDILTYIRQATMDDDGRPAIPIYVDPVGLRNARQTMQSKVSIDREGAALKHSLRMCLKKLGLAFSVRDGWLMICEQGDTLPVHEDPYLVVGHCVLALMAAALGGVLAALVSSTPDG